MRKLERSAMVVVGIIVVVVLCIGLPIMGVVGFRYLSENVFDPISKILNPTPTIVPDPVTIIHDVQRLARLETIQYTVEKVIRAEVGQDAVGFLFGDKLLFVGHGVVIAGVDMSKIGINDAWLEGKVLYLRLPEAEVFFTHLDNKKSYVYDRDTGVLTHGDKDLETKARQAAEEEIMKAAIEDGILLHARENAESYLKTLFRRLGYDDVVFLDQLPMTTPTTVPDLTQTPAEDEPTVTPKP